MLKQKNQQDFSSEQNNLSEINDSSIENQQSSLENVGKWNHLENLKYIVFLDFYKAQLSSKKKRRDNKMFNLISKFIVSRTPLQCRSHHQKLQKKYKSLKSLISAQKQEIGINQYRQTYRQMKTQLVDFDFYGKRQNSETFNVEIQTDITWVADVGIPTIPIIQQPIQPQFTWSYPQLVYPTGCYPFF